MHTSVHGLSLGAIGHSVAIEAPQDMSASAGSPSIGVHSSSIDLRRVTWAAGIMGLIFFLSDHDWLISRYDDFSGTSEFMETMTAEGNGLRRVVIFAMGGIGLWVLLRSAGYRLRIRSLMSVLMLTTAAWCLASWTWSIEPGIAARRLISCGCIAIAAAAGAKILKPRELAWAALACATAYLVIGVLAEMALGTFHPWRGDYRFAGTMHPNSQGMNCALIVLAAVYLAQHLDRRQGVFWSLAAIGLIGLWFTKSRTPLAALVVAQLSFWFLAASVRQKIGWGLATVGLACAVVLLVGEDVAPRLAQAALMGRGDEEETGSLTGRVPLWRELSESIQRRPLAGYGFSSFWNPTNIEEVSDSQSWAVSVAHSAYLDLALGIGLIGAGLCVAVVVLGLIKAVLLHVAAPEIGFGFIAPLLLFVLLHGLLESAFANPGFVPLVALSGLMMLGFVDPAQYQTESLLTDNL